MNQTTLFDELERFDGATYDHVRDYERLKTQLERVAGIISDGKWFTNGILQSQMLDHYHTHNSETALSARVRDLRKAKFAGVQIQHKRERETGGTWWYRVHPDDLLKLRQWLRKRLDKQQDVEPF